MPVHISNNKIANHFSNDIITVKKTFTPYEQNTAGY